MQVPLFSLKKKENSMAAIAVETKLKRLFKVHIEPKYRKLIAAVPLRPIHNQEEYHKYLQVLEFCFDVLENPSVSKNAKIILAEYAKVLGLLIKEYEKRCFPFSEGTQADILRFLMEEHHLTQHDLEKELGGQSVVSSILNGKRRLNVRQIARLSKRFNLSPATFFNGTGF